MDGRRDEPLGDQGARRVQVPEVVDLELGHDLAVTDPGRDLLDVGPPVLEDVVAEVHRRDVQRRHLGREVERRYDTKIEVFGGPSVEELTATHGEKLWERKPDLYLAVAKVEPLVRALGELDCWITGVRREHSDERSDVELASWDEERGLMKLNPIADWSTQELTAYIAENNIPVNPLHARGFTSIGCQPCTRAVQPGEHPRAGRWWWENEEKKECGLHMNPRREGKAA